MAVAFCIELSPFNNKPTIYRVIVEGIVYYIGVAIMEEIYLRGLLQNIMVNNIYFLFSTPLNDFTILMLANRAEIILFFCE